MKMKVLTIQQIYLDGFGFIEIAEGGDGVWRVDLFPRNSENDPEKILIESTMDANSTKYFVFPSEIAKQYEQE